MCWRRAATEREAGSSCSHLFLLLLLLLHRIIPFQRPLKIKELLQKVTEAFGQQMDMFFMEKEVKERQKRLLHVMPTLMRLHAIITEQPVMEMSCVFFYVFFSVHHSCCCPWRPRKTWIRQCWRWAAAPGSTVCSGYCLRLPRTAMWAAFVPTHLFIIAGTNHDWKQLVLAVRRDLLTQ